MLIDDLLLTRILSRSTTRVIYSTSTYVHYDIAKQRYLDTVTLKEESPHDSISVGGIMGDGQTEIQEQEVEEVEEREELKVTDEITQNICGRLV